MKTEIDYTGKHAISLSAHKAVKKGQFSSPLIEKIVKGAKEYSGLETCEMTLKYCFAEFKSMVAVRKAIKELLALQVLKVKRVTEKGYVIYEFV